MAGQSGPTLFLLRLWWNGMGKGRCVDIQPGRESGPVVVCAQQPTSHPPLPCKPPCHMRHAPLPPNQYDQETD